MVFKFQISVAVHPDYVKNIGNKFIYSQKAIDLVQQYMVKFPRVFELLNKSEAPLLCSKFDKNNNENGMEYVMEIRQWLQTLPHCKETLKSADFMRLTKDAIKDVQCAVNNAVNFFIFSFPYIFNQFNRIITD